MAWEGCAVNIWALVNCLDRRPRAWKEWDPWYKELEKQSVKKELWGWICIVKILVFYETDHPKSPTIKKVLITRWKGNPFHSSVDRIPRHPGPAQCPPQQTAPRPRWALRTNSPSHQRSPGCHHRQQQRSAPEPSMLFCNLRRTTEVYRDMSGCAASEQQGSVNAIILGLTLRLVLVWFSTQHCFLTRIHFAALTSG